MKAIIIILLMASPLFSQELYFPAPFNQNWETIAPSELGWCEENIDQVNVFLEESNTKAFIVLQDGKIAMESYFDDHKVDSPWYWASAGKSLTAVLTGMLQEDGLLNIGDPVSDYLGEGWTNCTAEEENNITVSHQLSMTTGLDYNVDILDCTDPECLNYLNDPNEEWFYHNAPYSLIADVLTNVTGETFTQLTNTRFANKLGFLGLWVENGYGNLFNSTARSMARFGLFMLAEGNWDGEQILQDEEYFQEMISPSQSINNAYGYLWWLNGGDSFRLPSTTVTFQGPLLPNAPDDLYAAIGKNGQICMVVPSENLVIVRMGENPDASLVPLIYVQEIWDAYIGLTCNTPVSDEQIIDFEIFPRLASDNLWIKTSLQVNRVEVIDRSGRVVMSVGKVDMLDVSRLTKGIYYLRIVSDGDRYSKRFVKI